MCLAVPAKIISIEGKDAKVDIMGVEGRVNVQLIEEPEAGDLILIHAGCAIQRINGDYFEELQELYRTMAE
jgi:hydrogenase expression/formation protein HypC